MFQLYNTLDGKKEDFKTIDPKKVRMYVCGPTVYDYDHLGHARTYLSFDLLNRFLRFLGYQVTYIQNITDVGHLANDAEVGVDKIQQRAQETGQTVRQIVDYFTKSHLEDMKSLHILAPSSIPRASEHINEIIDMVQELIDKGYAYITASNNVYFSVAKKADYGKLSHRGLTEILTGSRVESAPDKRSPADFALWKAAPVAKQEMTWNSPWGRGYPGWHIECSAMSRKYLGDTFDIHGSGLEHIFPHHENEIAQTESITNLPMAHFWIHTGMLNVGGQKMSKSLHNMVLIRDALKDYSANELRFAFFQTHYRRPFDYNQKVMEQGVVLRRKIFTVYPLLPQETDQQIWREIIAALEDDLNTPSALQLWGENAKRINRNDTNRLFEIFGIVMENFGNNPKRVQLANERDEARHRGDFLTADNRKAEIEQHWFEVVDTPAGTQYISR